MCVFVYEVVVHLWFAYARHATILRESKDVAVDQSGGGEWKQDLGSGRVSEWIVMSKVMPRKMEW